METVQRQYNFFRLYKRLLFAYVSNSYLLVSKIRRILYKWGVRIGQNTFIGRQVYFDELAPKSIEIGKNCHITQGVQILTHFLNPETGGFYTSLVVIGDNTFVGMNTLIIKPVKIGNNCII